MQAKAARSGLAYARQQQLKTVVAIAGFGTPAIGPDFAILSGTALADALVIARLRKHFPLDAEPLHPKIRKDLTIANMLEYDRTGVTRFALKDLNREQRVNFLNAQASLASFFKRVKRTHRFRPPSGETAIASHGDVDLIYKLMLTEQWTVSFEAAPEAAAVCYNHQKLKAVVRQRFRDTFPGAWRSMSDHWFTELGGVRNNATRFHVFVKQFTACCTILNYSRLSTVKKNATTDRPISMEPFWNMVAQLSFAGDLRDALMEVYGINLDTLADLHRTLIRHAEKATVDFSNASNSNWVAVLESLLPPKMFRKLMQLRTPVCYYKGKFHPYRMLAPMGCGFTFEVMTIVLLHLGRSLDPGTTVFGDDVIISADKADDFISLTGALGWKVNLSKTFTKGNFRESCGGFHDLSTATDLLSYEMHELETMADICTLANKCYHLIKTAQISKELRRVLTELYSGLVSTLPHVVWRMEQQCLTPLPEGVVIVPDLLYRNVVRQTTFSSVLSQFYHREMDVGSQYTREYEVDTVEVPTRVQMAAYMRRGSSYQLTNRHAWKETMKTVLRCGGGSLASVPLFSFI